MSASERLGDEGCRLGVLAFGDSITHGGGELQRGVALQSWALWTARGLGLPYSPYAADGALATDVTGHQIPAYRHLTATPGARYHLGCVYVGTNDVRRADWDPDRFTAQVAQALAFVREHCDRVLTATIPLDLGRPRAGALKVESANHAIERAAADHGALVLDLRAFGTRNTIMVDHVHPTAFGQIAIAERALAVLERDGMTIRVHPSQLLADQLRWHVPTRMQRLRGDLKYVYRHARISAQAARIVGAARISQPR
jgi:lysophospholipase L1-like esterase